MTMGAKYTLDADESAVLAALNRIEGGGATSAARLGKIFSESFNEIGRGFAPIGTALEKVGAGTTKVTIKVKTMEDSFKEASKTGKSFSDKFYAEIHRMLPSVEQLVISIGVNLVGALSSAMTKSWEMSVEFEKNLALISTLLERDQLPQMEQIKARVMEIFQTGVTSMKDLTGALYTTISYGVTDVGQALDVVAQAERSAIATASKVEVASEGVVVALNSWGKSTYSVKEINDLLFQTVKRAATNFPLLASNLGTVSGIAAQAGVSLQETLGAFSTLTKAGQSTQKAMTHLANMIVGLIKPSKQSQEAFNALGIEIGTAAIQSKGLSGIMEEIKVATGGNSEVIARLFPNIRALKAAVVLAGKGFQEFQTDLGFMKNSMGAADAAYERMIGTFWAQTKIMKNTFSGLGTMIAGEVGGFLSGFFMNVAAWVRENEVILKGWAMAIGSALGKLAIVVTTVIEVIWKLLAPVRAVFAAMGAAYAKLFGVGKKSTEQLQEAGAAGTQAGKAISTSMATANQNILATATSTKALTEALKTASTASMESALEQSRTRLYQVRSVIAAVQNVRELQQELGVGGGSQILAAKAQAQAAAQMAGIGAGTPEQMMAQAQAMAKQLASNVAEIEKQMGAQRLSTAKLTAKRLETEALSAQQKAWAKLQMNLKNLDYLRTLDPAAYAVAAANARRIYEREITKATKKPAKDPWADELGKSVEQSAIAAINAQEKAFKEAAKRNKASLFEAVGMVGFEGVSKEATEGAKGLAKQDKASKFISSAMAGAKKGQANYFDIVFGSKEELEKKFGEHLALFGLGIEQMRAHVNRFYSPDMISYISAWWGQITNTGRKGAEAMAGAVQSTMSLLINSLSTAWVDLWAGMVQGSKDSKQPMAAAVWDVVSQIATIWMGLAFALIPLLIAQYNYAGAALAFAAGVLLGIVAGAAKGAANKARESSGGTVSMNQGRMGGGASVDNTRTPDRSNEPRITNIYYGTIVPASREQITEFATITANALNASVNNNVRLKGELVEQKMRG